MLFAFRPAMVFSVSKSSGVPTMLSRPGSIGGRLPQAGATVCVGSWGGASPRTTRNWTACGLRLKATTGSEYASKKTRLYASGKSLPPLADIVLIATAKVTQSATKPVGVFSRYG